MSSSRGREHQIATPITTMGVSARRSPGEGVLESNVPGAGCGEEALHNGDPAAVYDVLRIAFDLDDGRLLHGDQDDGWKFAATIPRLSQLAPVFRAPSRNRR
jgi:hypothetical protein